MRLTQCNIGNYHLSDMLCMYRGLCADLARVVVGAVWRKECATERDSTGRDEGDDRAWIKVMNKRNTPLKQSLQLMPTRACQSKSVDDI
jgi:hypothetical protein